MRSAQWSARVGPPGAPRTKRLSDGHGENRVLSNLSARDYHALAPDLRLARLPLGAVLGETGEPFRDVYFPRTAVVSLLTVTSDGHAVETGLVGREGFIGLPALLADARSPWRAVVQASGEALVLPGALLQAKLAAHPALAVGMLRYMAALQTMAAQTIACNRFHEIPKRVARWLLMIEYLSGRSAFRLTQDFLATMLGVHRPTVTIALGGLQETGLISTRRGVLAIDDHDGLLHAACECYERIQEQLERVYR